MAFFAIQLFDNWIFENRLFVSGDIGKLGEES